MVCSIYKITNNINEKAYIGQTWKSLNTRISQHKSPNNKGCRKLYNALNKYGRDNFKIELITSCDNKMTADYLEIFWSNVFDSINNGYNLKTGGSHGKHTDETKLKISKALSGKKHSEQHKLNVSKAKMGNTAMVGRKHSETTKQIFKNKTWKLVDGKRVWIIKEGS